MPLTAAQRHTFAWIGIAFAASVGVWLLAPVLTPFVVGAVLAYALQPAVERLVRRSVPRLAAVLLVEVLFIVALLAVLLLIVPILTRELPLLREQIPVLAQKLNDAVSPWLARLGFEVSLDIDTIKRFVVTYLDANFQEWLAAALSSARIGGSFLLSVVGNAILIPVVLFYLLMDWPNVVRRLQALVPPRLLPSVASFADECDETLGQYLRGQLLVMVILAVYYSAGLAAFGFELAVPVGTFTGLAVFIPYLGYGLGLVLALMAAVLQFGSWFGLLAVAVIYGVGQVVESLYLTPRLVGERIGLNPLAVIFALLAFGQLFGFVGVLIALPVSAVLAVAVRRLTAAYLRSRLYTG